MERHVPGREGSMRNHTGARNSTGRGHDEQLIITAMPSARQRVARQTMLGKQAELGPGDPEGPAEQISLSPGARGSHSKVLHSSRSWPRWYLQCSGDPQDWRQETEQKSRQEIRRTSPAEREGKRGQQEQ